MFYPPPRNTDFKNLLKNPGDSKMFTNYEYTVTTQSTDTPAMSYSFKDKDKTKEVLEYLRKAIPFNFKKDDTVFFIADNKFVEATVDKNEILLQTNGDTISFQRLYDLNANGAIYKGICHDRLASSVQELYDKQKQAKDNVSQDMFNYVFGGLS